MIFNAYKNMSMITGDPTIDTVDDLRSSREKYAQSYPPTEKAWE